MDRFTSSEINKPPSVPRRLLQVDEFNLSIWGDQATGQESPRLPQETARICVFYFLISGRPTCTAAIRVRVAALTTRTRKTPVRAAWRGSGRLEHLRQESRGTRRDAGARPELHASPQGWFISSGHAIRRDFLRIEKTRVAAAGGSRLTVLKRLRNETRRIRQRLPGVFCRVAHTRTHRSFG